MPFNPLKHPNCLEFPERLAVSAWVEHVPFAMYLMAALRPRTVVELGAHNGVSYCAFCQATVALSLHTKCYAIDTWHGDEHASFYDDAVLKNLRAYHDPRYGSFSRLVQSTFEDALPQFEDGSLDLLHIDGLHTYEAVRSDYETWLPKMSANGVIIFHDTNVRDRNFGVWKLWAEIADERPRFEFMHGYGLGVLSVNPAGHEGLNDLFLADRNEVDAIRTFFHHQGRSIEHLKTIDELTARHVALQQLENRLDVRIGTVLATEGVAGVVKRAIRRLTR